MNITDKNKNLVMPGSAGEKTFKAIYILLIGISLMLIAGCSSDSPAEPGSPYDSMLPDSGHMILQAGTLEIDTQNNEIHQTTIDVDPIHNSIVNLMTNRINFTVENYNDPDITIKLDLINPIRKELFDMRIIFISLSQNERGNFDGYTNFYNSNWDYGYHPFVYLCKEFSLHKTPLMTESIISKDITFKWKDVDPPYLPYLIEASIGENTHEPYAIRNLSIDGDLTPIGGSAIASCYVDDWQNDISKVKFCSKKFSRQDLEMIKVGDTNQYLCNLINAYSLPPRVLPEQYSIWVIAESFDSDSVNLMAPLFFNIPDTTERASDRFDEPFSDPEKYVKQRQYPNKILEKLTFRFSQNDIYDSTELENQWEQLYPLNPQGELLFEDGMANYKINWYPPEVTEDTQFLFRVSAENPENHLISKAILEVPVELPRSPEIIKNPWVYQEEVFEQDECRFYIYAIDPNFPKYTYPDLNYTCVQLSPSEPHGIWSSYGYSDKYYSCRWTAPEIDEDTSFSFKVTVSKDWLNPPLEVSADLEFVVKNRD